MDQPLGLHPSGDDAFFCQIGFYFDPISAGLKEYEFPSAIHIAATRAVVRQLMPALRHLEEALAAKAEEFADVVKSGRTHLMDATPVTLGQEFGRYAAQVRYGVARLDASLPRLAELG